MTVVAVAYLLAFAAKEQQEEACRRYGNGAAFRVEATHDSIRSYEAKR